MAKRKILLFIVEGSTEETSLATVLGRIFTSQTVRFKVVHGDILTKDFITPDKILSAVNELIRNFRGGIYKASDICQVIHLVDMDGAYIPDTAVVEDHGKQEDKYPYYTEEQILTPTPETIIDRNLRKRRCINKLTGVGMIRNIPYSLYYFSSNLDHTLYGRTNLTEWEKVEAAEQFDLQYGEAPDAFIKFMKGSSFAVEGSYHDTWAFIKMDCHSLERFSNFGICLPNIETEETPVE